MGESVVAIGHYDRKVFLSERVPYERISASDLVLGTAARENGEIGVVSLLDRQSGFC